MEENYHIYPAIRRFFYCYFHRKIKRSSSNQMWFNDSGKNMWRLC